MTHDIELTKEEGAILRAINDGEDSPEQTTSEIFDASKRLLQYDYVTNDFTGNLVATPKGKKWLKDNF